MDRRKVGDESYREKFYSCGLSEHFEFIGRDWSAEHGRKVTIRCKSCEAILTTYGPYQYFRGTQTRVMCSECGNTFGGDNVWLRTPVCQEAMSYYSAGHSVGETAKKYGVTTGKILYATQRFGVKNGRNWKEAAADSNKRRHENAIARNKQILAAKEKERQQKAAELAAVRIAREEARKRQREKDQIQKREMRERARERAEAEKAEALFHVLNDKTHVCVECGAYFSVSEYMDYKGRKLIPTAPKYCSKGCERKVRNRARKKAPSGKSGNYYIRARKYGCEYTTGITLTKLIRRDGLRCAICGKMCDWDDHSWSEHSGPTYPSVDHIVPLANGGGHTWDNVQIAHIICNSRKSNTTTEVM